ncbi:MAG: DUF1330 domain-containing protein [Sphingomonas sp.]|nr:DUF1330 domain-containing protein [Sphingomonas sp.]
MNLRNDDRTMRELLEGLDFEQPIAMLNLIKFRAEAEYPDSASEPSCSGEEAYRRYGAGVSTVLDGMDASIMLVGAQELIGPDNEWDLAFVARYPTVHAFWSLIDNPDYQAIAHHRKAAVADSRLLAMKFSDGSLIKTLP